MVIGEATKGPIRIAQRPVDVSKEVLIVIDVDPCVIVVQGVRIETVSGGLTEAKIEDPHVNAVNGVVEGERLIIFTCRKRVIQRLTDLRLSQRCAAH